MNYSHTQVGKLMVSVIIFVAVLFAGISLAAGEEFDLQMFGLMIVVLLAIGSFATLTVSIDQEYLRIKFGYGIFRKKFRLADIVSVRATKHKWYHGWGIRFWFWPRMVIYNISGWDVAEIKMTDGMIYRIGSDEVEKLVDITKNNIKK